MTTKSQDVRAASADRLSRAYAEGNAVPPTRRTRDEKVAAAFRPDARHERLLALRRDDPAAFAELPPSARLGLAHYETAKEAHGRREEANGA